MKAKRTILIAVAFLMLAGYSFSQVLWVPGGYTNIGNNSPNSNVGIGISAPLSTLDVNGGMAIGTYAGTDAASSGSLIVSGNIGAGSYQPDELLTAGFPAIADGNIALWSATVGDNVGGSLIYKMRVAGGYSKSIIGKIEASSYNSGSGNKLNFYVGSWNNNNNADTKNLTGGIYSYSIVVDGVVKDTKKMVKE